MTDRTPDPLPALEAPRPPWERVAELERRVAELEARLEALDATLLRHMGQNESDLDRLTRTVDRVGEERNRHVDAHWRSGR